MEIIFEDNIKKIKKYSLNGFCSEWKKPLNEIELKKLCKNSSHFILAIDKEKNKVVGIITALSDNINWTFIQYLEILKEYQKNGIGSELIKRILNYYKNINCVDLTCNENVQSFYEKFGMKKSHGMIIRNY